MDLRMERSGVAGAQCTGYAGCWRAQDGATAVLQEPAERIETRAEWPLEYAGTFGRTRNGVISMTPWVRPGLDRSCQLRVATQQRLLASGICLFLAWGLGCHARSIRTHLAGHTGQVPAMKKADLRPCTSGQARLISSEKEERKLQTTRKL
jgi:hypothetical protein